MLTQRFSPLKVTFAVFVLLLFPGCPNAQSPRTVTATYGDWTVICSNQNKNTGGACALAQSEMMPGHPNPVSQIAISRLANGKTIHILFYVPVNLWFESGVTLLSDNSERLLVVPFRYCIPSKCVADLELTNADIEKLRTQTRPGRMIYKNALQSDVTIPVSFAGFGDALNSSGLVNHLPKRTDL
jgi:invasion protein IalB